MNSRASRGKVVDGVDQCRVVTFERTTRHDDDADVDAIDVVTTLDDPWTRDANCAMCAGEILAMRRASGDARERERGEDQSHRVRWRRWQRGESDDFQRLTCA